MKVLLVGYNNGVLSALDRAPLDKEDELYEVWVVEEPDLWKAKNLEEKARKHSCFRGVHLAEYQQSDAYLSQLDRYPKAEAIVPGLEYAVPAAAKLAEAMGKAGCGSKTAEIIRDKLKFREATSSHGLASPRYEQVSSASDIAVFLAQGPAVLKPAQRQASLGVRILDADADCSQAWEELIAADEGVQIANRPMKWTYLIEEKLVGTEFSTEVLVDDGEIVFLNVTKKATRDGAFPVELAHILPWLEREDEWKECIRLLINAVGFQSGMIHAEWMLTASGPVPIECAGRPPGDRITELIDIAWDFSFIRAWIQILAGATPALPEEPRQAAAIQFIETKPGVVAKLPDVGPVEANHEVVSVEITATVGKQVGEVRSSWDRSGNVIAHGSDPETALLNANRAANQIEIRMEDQAMSFGIETQKPVVLFLNTRRTELEFAPPFEAAHALGYRVFLITDDPNTEIKAQYADQVFTMDTFDAEGVIQLARNIARQSQVVGVLTFSDRDVTTVAQIAEQLNLPGVPLAAANLSRNKAAMRQALSNFPELIPAYCRVTDGDSLEQARRVVGFPGVLKPTTGSGSKGIFKVQNATELEQAWRYLVQYTSSGGDKVFKDSAGELVYERLLQGTEHSVEGVVSNGDIHIAGITDKTTTEDFALEVAHEFPSALPAEAKAEITSLCRTVVRELGFDNCAFHLECFMEADGRARLVEVAARTGGDFIASHLVSAASGRNFLQDVIRAAVGQEIAPYSESCSRIARVEKLISQNEGVLKAVKGWPMPSHQNGVIATVVERAVGASVELPPKDFMSCVIGAVIGVSTADERDRLRSNLAEALRDVEIEVGQ